MSETNRSLSRLLTGESHLSETFWLTFVPIVGNLFVIRESNRVRDITIARAGWIVFGLSLILGWGEWFLLVWIVQIGLALWLRSQHLIPLPTPPQKVNFNSCSKNDLVRILDLPIVYANDIDLARAEGFIFTHAEELSEIAGLPEEQVERIRHQLIFSYDEKQDGISSWRRINVLSPREMTAEGINADTANKIVAERETNGDYRSAMDIKRRTGISFWQYRDLI
ncbi:MAG: helix-hairpin-helix domain-containing protein [Cyanobacteria bacterium J06627_28]